MEDRSQIMDSINHKWEEMDNIEAIATVRKISNLDALVSIAKDCAHPEASYEALEKVSDYALLKDIMETAQNDVIRMVAAEKALNEAIQLKDVDMIVDIMMVLTSINIPIDAMIEASMEAFRKVVEGLSDKQLLTRITNEILENRKSQELSALLNLVLDHTDDQALLQRIVDEGRSEYSAKIRIAAVKKITVVSFLQTVVLDEAQEYNVRLSAMDSLTDPADLHVLIRSWLPNESYLRLFDLAIKRLTGNDFELLSSVVLQARQWDHRMTAWGHMLPFEEIDFEKKQSLFHEFIQLASKEQEAFQLVKTIPVELYGYFDLSSRVHEEKGEDEFGKYTDLVRTILYRGKELFQSA